MPSKSSRHGALTRRQFLGSAAAAKYTRLWQEAR